MVLFFEYIRGYRRIRRMGWRTAFAFVSVCICLWSGFERMEVELMEKRHTKRVMNAMISGLYDGRHTDPKVEAAGVESI